MDSRWTLSSMTQQEMADGQEGIRADLQVMLDSSGGRGAIAASNLATGERLLLNADIEMPSASLIKIPIMAACETLIEAGGLSREDELGSPSQPVSHLMREMIRVSDNDATNLLTERVGMDHINETCQRLGMEHTRMERVMLDWEARQAGRENVTTAADMLTVLTDLARGTVVSQEASRQTRQPMLDQHHRAQIPAGLPPDVVVANKTGGLDDVAHDAAIAYTPFGRVAMVVMFHCIEPGEGIEQLSAQVATKVYHHFSRAALHVRAVPEGVTLAADLVAPCTLWLTPNVSNTEGVHITATARSGGRTAELSVELPGGARVAALLGQPTAP